MNARFKYFLIQNSSYIVCGWIVMLDSNLVIIHGCEMPENRFQWWFCPKYNVIT